MDVARPCLTSDCRTHQEPDHAADDGHGCDDEWRVEDEIFRERDRNDSYPRVEERKDHEDREGEPGPGPPYLIRQLESKDLEKLHVSVSRRPRSQCGCTGPKASRPGLQRLHVSTRLLVEIPARVERRREITQPAIPINGPLPRLLRSSSIPAPMSKANTIATEYGIAIQRGRGCTCENVVEIDSVGVGFHLERETGATNSNSRIQAHAR